MFSTGFISSILGDESSVGNVCFSLLLLKGLACLLLRVEIGRGSSDGSGFTCSQENHWPDWFSWSAAELFDEDGRSCACRVSLFDPSTVQSESSPLIHSLALETDSPSECFHGRAFPTMCLDLCLIL